MPTIAQCSQCQRIYRIVGPHSGTMMAMWTCPRCKRGRNLPRESVPERRPVLGSSP